MIVFFFIFAGNMGKIGGVNALLSALMDKHALPTCVLASQVVSNVPAAVLLAGFSQDWRALLTGTNLGGLGTPIASLASLISLKFYARSAPGGTRRYLLIFSAVNVAALALLYALAAAG